MFSGNFLISFPFVSATNHADEVHYVSPCAAYIDALANSLQGWLGELEWEYGCVPYGLRQSVTKYDDSKSSHAETKDE